MNGWVRPPCVAGYFYADDPRRLARDVDFFVAGGLAGLEAPKALIVPHAGYRYSGSVAGRGYARLLVRTAPIERVVLVGPTHRVPVEGIVVSSAASFATPLGLVPVDQEATSAVLTHATCKVDDDTHRREHSLEVQLPFLQRVLEGFSIVPLLAGRISAEAIADVLDTVWGGPETLIVVTTDLSHYHDHETASDLDRRTAEVIVSGDASAVSLRDACGAVPLAGVLEAARRRGLHVDLLDLRTSGDTAGTKDRVVGYGAFALV
jgi:MEMO1 family protein